MTKPLTEEQRQYVERGLIIVRQAAFNFARKWPSIAEEDFVSVGYEILVRAASRFDPSRGVPFESYIRIGMNFAMLDLAHRERFHFQRPMRSLVKALVMHAIEGGEDLDAWLEPPAKTETSGAEEVVAGLMTRIADLTTVALAGGTRVLSVDEDTLVEEVDQRIAIVKLRAALADLSDEERAFVKVYYEEERPIAEVMDRVGVARRTVFRMRDRVLAKLAAALAA